MRLDKGAENQTCTLDLYSGMTCVKLLTWVRPLLKQYYFPGAMIVSSSFSILPILEGFDFLCLQAAAKAILSGRAIPAVEVPAVPTNHSMAPAKTQLLQEVSPPPCLVLHFLAESSTACHHFCFAFLVLQACDDFFPPELHLSCPSVRVTAVVPVPPLLVPEVLPASSTPFLVAGNACPSPGKKPSPAVLVLHAPHVTKYSQFAVMGPPLLPEKKPFPH